MTKLNRTTSHRDSMIRNLAISLVLHEVVTTTVTKAKLAQRFLDRMISKAKSADETAKKYLDSITTDEIAKKKIIEVLLPRYKNRQSGFTTITRVGIRVGDSSEMCELSLIDGKKVAFVKRKESKPTKKSSKPKTKAKAKSQKQTQKTEPKAKVAKKTKAKTSAKKDEKKRSIGDRLTKFLGLKNNKKTQVKPEDEK